MKLARSGLILLLLPFISTAQSSTSATAFRHVTVIDMTGNSAHPNMPVLIVGNRIQTIGKNGKVRVPKGAQVIDAKDKFVIPGLWDMHVHALWPWRIGTYFPLFVASGTWSVAATKKTLRNQSQVVCGSSFIETRAALVKGWA